MYLHKLVQLNQSIMLLGLRLELNKIKLLILKKEKESACNAGARGDTRSIPGSGRSPGGGNDNPLQHSCWDNPMDRAAWRATVHGVAKSQIQLKRLSTHALLTASSLGWHCPSRAPRAGSADPFLTHTGYSIIRRYL